MSVLSRPCILYGELDDRPALPPGQEYIFIALDTGQIYLSNLTRTAWVAVGVTEAGSITYTPGESDDWSPVPDDVAEALDQAAQRVARLESVAPALPRQNLLPLPFFDRWANGTSAAPAEWTLSGSGASAGRASAASDVKYGRYAFRVTRASADATATLNVLTYYPASMFTGRRLKFGAWVKCSAANRGRISVNIDSTPTYSTYHTGGGTYEFLEVAANFISTPSTFTVRLHVDGSAGNAIFDAVILTENHLGADTVPYAAPPFNSLPDRATLFHDQSVILVGNALSYAPDTALEGTTRQNAAAMGDTFSNSFLLRRGTYTLFIVGQTTINSAICTWYVNQTSIGTHDMYNSAAFRQFSITGVTIPYDGLHEIQGSALTRNGSASGWELRLQRYWFVPED